MRLNNQNQISCWTFEGKSDFLLIIQKTYKKSNRNEKLIRMKNKENRTRCERSKEELKVNTAHYEKNRDR